MGRCRSVSLLGCPFSVGLSFSVFSLQRSLSHPSCCSVILADISCLSSLICESWSQTLFLPGETHAHLPNASPALSLQAWSSPLLLKPLVPSVSGQAGPKPLSRSVAGSEPAGSWPGAGVLAFLWSVISPRVGVLQGGKLAPSVTSALLVKKTEAVALLPLLGQSVVRLLEPLLSWPFNASWLPHAAPGWPWLQPSFSPMSAFSVAQQGGFCACLAELCALQWLLSGPTAASPSCVD